MKPASEFPCLYFPSKPRKSFAEPEKTKEAKALLRSACFVGQLTLSSITFVLRRNATIAFHKQGVI